MLHLLVNQCVASCLRTSLLAERSAWQWVSGSTTARVLHSSGASHAAGVDYPEDALAEHNFVFRKAHEQIAFMATDECVKALHRHITQSSNFGRRTAERSTYSAWRKLPVRQHNTFKVAAGPVLLNRAPHWRDRSRPHLRKHWAWPDAGTKTGPPPVCTEQLATGCSISSLRHVLNNIV